MRPRRAPRSLRVRLVACLAAASATCLTVGRAAEAAIDLVLVPDPTQVEAFDTVNVAVTISGLGDGGAPSVGVFELEVGFDEARLALGEPLFGDPVLGDQLALQQTSSIETGAGTSGQVNLFELSLDTPEDLDALQAPSFTMVTIPFTALANGPANVTLTITTLGDAGGGALTATAGGTTIQVPESGPTPSGVAAMGALGIFLRRRRDRRTTDHTLRPRPRRAAGCTPLKARSGLQ